MVDDARRRGEGGLEAVKFFESLLRKSSDGIVVTGMMQNIIVANEAFCGFFGRSKHEMMETGLLAWLEQAGPDAVKSWIEMEELVYSRGSCSDMEFRVRRGNNFRYFSVNASRLELSPKDDKLFILSLWRDVTRSREAEETLRKYREDLELRVRERTAGLELERKKLKGILDSMPDGAYVVSRQNEIEYINPVIEREFGPVNGRKCHEYFHDLPSACTWCRNADVFSGKTVRWEWSSSKTGKTYELFDTPIVNEDGTVSKLEFFHDITERNKAQEALVKSEALLREKILELEQKNRELQEITFVAAHDLQEPLRKIQIWSDLLDDKYSGVFDETGRGYLGRVKDGASRMRSLINDALTYSRISMAPMSFEVVDLNRIVGAVLSDMEHRIRLEEAEIKVENMLSIPADPAQMRQLFHELVNNALKYRGKAAPSIRIQGSIEGRTYRIFVEDNGIGFDGGYADKIFEPFERLHRQDSYEGTGIGLALCRRIAERHGGRITARSALGKGSIFVITIPLKHLDGI